MEEVRKQPWAKQGGSEPTKQCGSCIFVGKCGVCQVHKLAGKEEGGQVSGQKEQDTLLSGRGALNRVWHLERSPGPSMSWDINPSSHVECMWLRGTPDPSQGPCLALGICRGVTAGFTSAFRHPLSTHGVRAPDVQAVVFGSGNDC